MHVTLRLMAPGSFVGQPRNVRAVYGTVNTGVSVPFRRLERGENELTV